MNVNNDFSAKVVIDTNWLRWVESPARGVERKFLDRVGNEVARASSFESTPPVLAGIRDWLPD
jgi:anti-sigma factor ChrR (cupin superfamily)